MLTLNGDRIARARMLLEGRGLVAADLLPTDIAASWERCLQAGLDPARPPPGEAATDVAKIERERHERALRLATAEMQTLYQQIAGTNFMIAFAAPCGTLLETICDPTFDAASRGAAIRAGARWTERRHGTNALGTTALTGQPIVVHGAEHFFRSHAGLTCTATPVFGPQGRMVGILDASSDSRSRQQHTPALLALAASHIESGLFWAHHRSDVVLSFHARREFLDTLGAGLLAFAGDGQVCGSNSQARILLEGLSVGSGERFETLFDTPWPQLMGSAGELSRLRDRLGRAFAAECRAPVRPPRPALALAGGGPAVTPASARRAIAVASPAVAFVADDPAVRRAVALTEAAARQNIPILIRGPTGTGKEALARHAHTASGRKGAFVPVNCAAIAESLAEAELFGHAPGAFTGARQGGAPGLVVEADHGTLFLDEVGDMKPALQALLLRLLDDWSVRPVGGGRSRTVDVLLVAATNCDLAHAVEAGRFRADLYWRLNVAEAVLPALSERTDIAAITDHLLAHLGLTTPLSPEMRAWIGRRPWPGNVRELRSVLTRQALTGAAAPVGPEPKGADAKLETGLRAGVRARVRAVHSSTHGNIAETARTLGVSRNTVYRALRTKLLDD